MALFGNKTVAGGPQLAVVSHRGRLDVVALERRHGDKPRVTSQQDPWHYTLARMVDACTANGIYPYYGPFGAIDDPVACEDQFRAAFLLGCVGAWSLHPSQVEIARRVFSPAVDEVRWARRVIAEMGDGTGVVMLEGKMQDDATVKQCRVMVDLAKKLAVRHDSGMHAAHFSTNSQAVSGSVLLPPRLAAAGFPLRSSSQELRPATVITPASCTCVTSSSLCSGPRDTPRRRSPRRRARAGRPRPSPRAGC